MNIKLRLTADGTYADLLEDGDLVRTVPTASNEFKRLRDGEPVRLDAHGSVLVTEILPIEIVNA